MPRRSPVRERTSRGGRHTEGGTQGEERIEALIRLLCQSSHGGKLVYSPLTVSAGNTVSGLSPPSPFSHSPHPRHRVPFVYGGFLQVPTQLSGR